MHTWILRDECPSHSTAADVFFSLVDLQMLLLVARSSSGRTSSGGDTPGKDYGELLSMLRDALSQDGSGMLFNETARGLRPDGLFRNEFFDHVSDLTAAADSEAER